MKVSFVMRIIALLRLGSGYSYRTRPYFRVSIGVLGLCPERVQRLLVTLLATGNREERSVAGTAERLGGFGKPGVDGLVVHNNKK